MRGKRWAAVVLILGLSGLLAGCCLLSGNPTVTISGPTTASVGQAVMYSATATGGGGTYTYQWSFGASGQSATHTFQSTGSQMISVTVTDRCGKVATAQTFVNVTEGGGNLNGMWTGTIYDNRGASVQFSLQLIQTGTNVTGTAYLAGLSSPGSGSFAGGQFQFAFQWPRTTDYVILVGTYSPHANELSGDWTAGGIKLGTWRVRR